MRFSKPAQLVLGRMKLPMAPYILFEERQACYKSDFCVVLSASGLLVPAGWGWLDQCNYPRGCHCARLHPSALLPHLWAAAWVRVRVSGAGQEQIWLERRQQTLHLLHKHQRYESFILNYKRLFLSVSHIMSCSDLLMQWYWHWFKYLNTTSNSEIYI